MPELAKIRAQSKWSDILEGQPQHLAILFFMICGFALLLPPTSWPNSFLGLDSHGWAWLSVWLAVIHQVMVAVVFRLQLHREVMTRLFGDRDLRVWGWMFFPFLIARPLTILVVGILDTGSLGLPTGVAVLLGIALLVPAAWTMRVVATEFTFARALGGDHFRDAYQDMPMVRSGPFGWTPNAMYSFGFLGLWGIALLCNSREALIVAAFQHAYIWVHMYCTEQADMDWIFGTRAG